MDLKTQTELELWKKASTLYYSDNGEESPLTDLEFDQLTEKLKSYNIPEITDIVTKTIQTKDGLVNAELVLTEMVSLFKIQWNDKARTLSVRDIMRWFGLKTTNDLNNLYIGLKFDGHACKLTFKDGELVQAISRGGVDWTKYFVGTNMLKKVMNQITKAGYSLTNNIYHCELVLEKDLYNTEYSKYKNPRNAVSGVLKINPEHLTLIPLTDGINPLIKHSIWQTVGDLFKPSFGEGMFVDRLSDIYRLYKTDSFKYQVDGFVIGVMTDKWVLKDNYPMNLVSVKFEAVRVITKVTGIEWSQGKTGSLTPVYLLEPVNVDGSTVTRAAGYNYDHVMNLKAGVGASVEIEKSNDIIPIITRVIVKSRDIPLPMVDYKIIGKEAVATDDQVSKEFKFVLGLKLLKIEGIGDVLAGQIGEVVGHDIVNAFDVKYKPQLLEVLGGGANWSKFKQIYDITSLPLDLMIEMLQFNGVGPKLANKFAVMVMSKQWSSNGIDQNVYHYVKTGEGRTLIHDAFNRFKQLNIKILAPIVVDESTITFEMSNSPAKISKNDFVKLFKRKYPNSQHTTLTKNTTLLIVDSMDASTSKMNRARKYNIEIITYEQALTTFKPKSDNSPEEI